MNSFDALMLSASRPRGPIQERRRAGASSTDLLMRMLDEIDYGLLLVTGEGQLRYANQLALNELGSGGPLQMAGEHLCLHADGEAHRLHVALADAMRGRRTLVNLGHNGHALPVAVIPLAGSDDAAAEHLALLVFNKRASCAALTIDFYARSNGLTATESTVLVHLSQGLKPKAIARVQGVALSTVRSQISSIRSKTRTASIGELTACVAVLPPFAPAVKSARIEAPRAVTAPLAWRRRPADAAPLLACAAC